MDKSQGVNGVVKCADCGIRDAETRNLCLTCAQRHRRNGTLWQWIDIRPFDTTTVSGMTALRNMVVWIYENDFNLLRDNINEYQNKFFRFYNLDAPIPEPLSLKAEPEDDAENLVVPFDLEMGEEVKSTTLRGLSRAWRRTLARLRLDLLHPERAIAERAIRALGIGYRYGDNNSLRFFKLPKKD